MGALVRVAIPDPLPGAASAQDGSLVSGLASAMAADRARARRWLDAVAAETGQPTGGGDEGGAGQAAAEVISGLLAGRRPTLLGGGCSRIQDVVRAGIISSRTNAALPPATAKAESATAVPRKLVPPSVMQTIGRPCGRRRIDTRRQEIVVLDWMLRDGRPALEFKHEELIRAFEREFINAKTRPSWSTLRRRALEILERYEQLRA